MSWSFSIHLMKPADQIQTEDKNVAPVTIGPPSLG